MRVESINCLSCYLIIHLRGQSRDTRLP